MQSGSEVERRERAPSLLTRTRKETMFLREAEVAQILRRTVATVKLWRANGTGPKYVKLAGRGKRGGGVLYDALEVARFIKAQPVHGGAPVCEKEVQNATR